MTRRGSGVIAGMAAAGLIVAAVEALPAAHGGLPSARPGTPAPEFAVRDIAGKLVRLADFAGRTVILEWTNDGCPFVRKHYDSGNMQQLQQRYTAAGAIWLTIASSAPGEQGYVTPVEARADILRWHAAPSDFLLDPDGTVGRLYDARATPHMVVIDRTGTLAYMGAIDDVPSTDRADVKTARNYVVAALDDLAAGRKVAVAATRAYGCSVKYRGG